ncbi:MAG: DMT family transporter, partial [Clostridia bacterium]|nr:DMT family transporter [Clostridia bacterium]
YTSLQYIFFYVGLSNTTGAAGSVVNSASVFVAIIFAHFVYPDDKITVKKLFGCIIGFSGVVIACIANEGISGVSLGGEGLILIAGTFFVIGSMINKKASKLNSSYTVTAYNLLIGGFLLIIIGAIGNKEGITVTLPGVAALMYLIMVSSVGFTMWSMLLKTYPIGKLSVYNFIIPVSGTILSGLFLKENIFTWQYISALILVSAGIFVLNYSKE